MTDLFSAAHARHLDASDVLPTQRAQFHIPKHAHADGSSQEMAYFCGNSLGLQPKGAAAIVQAELDDWAELAVEAHFRGRSPWMHYHSFVRDGLAHVVGAEPQEVVAMNTLTANLHLLMVSFYRPTKERPAILIEAGAFPSDRHAVESQIRFHGFNPETDLIELAPDEPGGTISMEAIERVLTEHGPRIALILWPGVQYRSGQAFDINEIVKLGHAQGCVVGFDLAHAAGNLQLQLHDSDVDFAAWCHYKYLNSGPGAVAGAFVHARHAHTTRPRFAGWWGHDASTRFKMGPEFTPTAGAEGWQLSNPPVLGLAPLRASLDLFQSVGMTQLRKKSERLTAYLQALIETQLSDKLQIVTPSDPTRRGCQLSLRVIGGRERGRDLFAHLERHGVLGDWREPDVIRISPAPLYNTFLDIQTFAQSVTEWTHGA